MKVDKVADMTVEDKVKQTRWARCPGSGVQGQGPGVRAGGLEVGAQRAPRLLVDYIFFLSSANLFILCCLGLQLNK